MIAMTYKFGVSVWILGDANPCGRQMYLDIEIDVNDPMLAQAKALEEAAKREPDKTFTVDRCVAQNPKRKFLIVETQGGGCDYTIGCGVCTYEMEAESMGALLATLKQGAFVTGDARYDTEQGDWLEGERARARVEIYEVANTFNVPLDEWRSEHAGIVLGREVEEHELRERELLAKLRKKYEGR